MRASTIARTVISSIILIAGTACGVTPPADGHGLAARAQQTWSGDWHAVWQIEWSNAPVRGPLVAEVWHTADGRLRIETLEAPTTALSSLTLVNDGTTVWLYDLRQNRVESGSGKQVGIPLASDALDAVDWLLLGLGNATITIAGHDNPESGPASRLAASLTSGDRATIWIHDETGLPARVELHSAIWGEATFTTRRIAATTTLPPALFTFQPPPSVEVVTQPRE